MYKKRKRSQLKRKDRKIDLEIAQEIARQIYALGGKCYFVGEYIRDKLLGNENNCMEIEVYGIDEEHLEKILKRLQKTD